MPFRTFLLWAQVRLLRIVFYLWLVKVGLLDIFT